MKILAIESAALVASCALLTEETLLAEYSLNTKLTHSQTLLPLIDAMMKQTECRGEEIDAIAVSAGPGSFTGLRIGAATAKGLGMAWGKPLVPVPTLEGLAYVLWGSRLPLCPIMDARRDQVYAGLYRFTEQGDMETLLPGAPRALEALLSEIAARGERVLFLGDGLPVFRDRIRQLLPELAAFAPPHLSREKASAAGARGLVLFREGKSVEASAFAPQYLRPSQAERVRAEREGEGHDRV